MAIKTIETFTAELLGHLLNGLEHIFHADYAAADHWADPLLKSKLAKKGSAAVVEYKGQFYMINVERLES